MADFNFWNPSAFSFAPPSWQGMIAPQISANGPSTTGAPVTPPPVTPPPPVTGGGGGAGAGGAGGILGNLLNGNGGASGNNNAMNGLMQKVAMSMLQPPTPAPPQIQMAKPVGPVTMPQSNPATGGGNPAMPPPGAFNAPPFGNAASGGPYGMLGRYGF